MNTNAAKHKQIPMKFNATEVQYINEHRGSKSVQSFIKEVLKNTMEADASTISTGETKDENNNG